MHGRKRDDDQPIDTILTIFGVVRTARRFAHDSNSRDSRGTANRFGFEDRIELRFESIGDGGEKFNKFGSSRETMF